MKDEENYKLFKGLPEKRFSEASANMTMDAYRYYDNEKAMGANERQAMERSISQVLNENIMVLEIKNILSREKIRWFKDIHGLKSYEIEKMGMMIGQEIIKSLMFEQTTFRSYLGEETKISVGIFKQGINK
jgi:hypothetical protein